MEGITRIHRSLLGGEEEQDEDFLGESNGPCSLSPLQRLYGFAACLVAGLACMLLNWSIELDSVMLGIVNLSSNFPNYDRPSGDHR